MIDHADPAARARAEVARRRRRDRVRRVATACGLVGVAAALPITAHELAGGGAAIGAGVAALLLAGLAVAVWPYAWTPEERAHRELDAIWREMRPDADEDVSWERHLAWADSADGAVELYLIRRQPSENRVGEAPSPYSRGPVHTVDPDDIAAAAEAMERLRADAEERERSARRRHEAGQVRAERLAHERALSAIDEAAAAEMRRRDEALRRELSEREAVERAAQADALARALRRP